MDSLYVRKGSGFAGTEATGSSWYADAQAGGAVLALLGHVLEDVPTLTPMSLTRLTVDLVRPVPKTDVLVVENEVLREGKKIQLVEQTVRSGTDVCVRARALRIRDSDQTGSDAFPASTSQADPAAALPPPEELDGLPDDPRVAAFLRHGAEMRRTSAPVGGVHGIWVRLRVPVVAGEPVRATSRAVLPMDTVNLLGVYLTAGPISAINPDVSAHLFRPPTGEWVALVGNTWFDARVAHGMSAATLCDAEGVLGVTSTSQIVQ